MTADDAEHGTDEVDTTVEESDPAHDHHHDHDSGADVGHDVGAGRTTAPMSEFTGRAVGIGVLVLAAGLLVAFALPFLTV